VSDAAARHSPGYLVVELPGGEKSRVPVFDQLFVGRECIGVHAARRLVIDDPEISRNHLEIHLDAESDQAFVIDTSTNGTRLNGSRLERAVPMAIKSGDHIRIGDVRLTFQSMQFIAIKAPGESTVSRISEAAMVMVVGDITNYSTISEVTDNRVIAQGLKNLWRELSGILRTHFGTLSHYAGDAIYAVWDVQTHPKADEFAIDFALAANRRVEELAPELPLRSPDNAPISMGWGVVHGMAALAAMTRSVEAVVGDATNVAFRLAGLAGREGRRPVYVTSAVHESVEDRFAWGEPEQVVLKGRRGLVTVFPVIGRPVKHGIKTQPTLSRTPIR
jgi:adenylate cyclase